jgi:hypothetical protein
MNQMEPSEFISSLPSERQALLTELHKAIMSNDPSISAVVKPMMGSEMILYEERGYMKYGLASTKKYMSLHCLPMYMNPSLHTKFTARVPEAKFQKGCINFADQAELPPTRVGTLIAECATISIADMLEKRKKK